MVALETIQARLFRGEPDGEVSGGRRVSFETLITNPSSDNPVQ